jgi:hypothetical protein
MAASISVSETATPDTFLVEVKGRSTTQHRVDVSPAYLRELGIETQPRPRVLQESFAFLLEREPNTSILTTFDLRDIERYFPEFRDVIAQRLRG